MARVARLAAVTEKSIPPPDDWSQHVRAGLLHALALVRAAVFFVRGWAENSPLPRALRQGKNERFKTQLQLAQQEQLLNDAHETAAAGSAAPLTRPSRAPTIVAQWKPFSRAALLRDLEVGTAGTF